MLRNLPVFCLTIILIGFLLLTGESPILSQTLILPSPSSLSAEPRPCSEHKIGIASEYWRVKKGDQFAVSAIHTYEEKASLRYLWAVSNAQIVTGQGSKKIIIKAGSLKTHGFLNASGFVKVSLIVERAGEKTSCVSEASHSVMIGRHRESNNFAQVENLTLSETEINLSCSDVAPNMLVDVSVTGIDAENDPLTFIHYVSAGKVIGSGRYVKWDLTGVKLGMHQIWVYANDGCGPCGQPNIKTIKVVMCKQG